VRKQQAKREEERRQEEAKRRERETNAYEKAKKAREDATNSWWKAQEDATKASGRTTGGRTSAEDFYQRYKQERTGYGGSSSSNTRDRDYSSYGTGRTGFGTGTSGFGGYSGYTGSSFGGGYSGYSAGSARGGSSSSNYGYSGSFYAGGRNAKPTSPVKDYDALWQNFEKNVPSVIKMTNIPFPSKSWFCSFPMDSAEREKKFKKLVMRWHPDKFQQKYGKKLDPKTKDKILEKVKEVFQLVSDAREEPKRNMRF